MDRDEIRRVFSPAIEEIAERCSISDRFVDKEMFQVYIATIWGNAVLDPARSGLDEADLTLLHDFLNEEVAGIVGREADVTGCFEFIVSKEGDDALVRLGISQRHKEFLHYFARLILRRDLQTVS